MFMNVTKISQRMKNKSLFSTEKILQTEKKYFSIKSNDFESSFESIYRKKFKKYKFASKS